MYMCVLGIEASAAYTCVHIKQSTAGKSKYQP